MEDVLAREVDTERKGAENESEPAGATRWAKSGARGGGVLKAWAPLSF